MSDVTLEARFLLIHADVAGLNLQVAPGHIVECHVPTFEPNFQIVLG